VYFEEKECHALQFVAACTPSSMVSGFVGNSIDTCLGTGIRCVVLVTQRRLHAFECVRDLPLAEVELYTGILAVRNLSTTNLSLSLQAFVSHLITAHNSWVRPMTASVAHVIGSDCCESRR
jgi:hypothetical protein